MTTEDGHFRTDGKTIEPCCIAMDSFACTELLNGYNGWKILWYPTRSKDSLKEVLIRACPFCGAKLEYVKTLVGENQ